MNKKSLDLLEKNQYRLTRAEKFKDFSNALQKETANLPTPIKYADYDETKMLLESLKQLGTSNPEKHERGNINSIQLTTLIECLKQHLTSDDVYVILYDHYLFIGAMSLTLPISLDNIFSFFNIGEESIVIIDKKCKNYLTFSNDKPLTDENIVYELNIGGTSWPTDSEKCLNKINK